MLRRWLLTCPADSSDSTQNKFTCAEVNEDSRRGAEASTSFFFPHTAPFTIVRMRHVLLYLSREFFPLPKAFGEYKHFLCFVAKNNSYRVFGDK